MAYVDYNYFASLYGETITEAEFNNLEWDARRIMDANTTGIDNVRKLREYFPTDAEDAEAVKRCMCKLIMLMHTIEQKSTGAVTLQNGVVASGVVSSVSSGAESMTFETGGTAIDKAVGDISARNVLYIRTVRDGLSGVVDANGVNLLYMGVYPYVR